ncbi:MAG TPA: molybdate ABC transporter substrate-binding protein [Deltaproteobacteria bacterium]|nr:molybdate ABC transporter substrate-binding protein [Deltaproteobacteria bacterium]HPJ92774.1 molybdate ABC transporter substrate-binding protein [Deltaproteobacteria bacterium]HPR50769.1 molybdate ABC transporter substrate-binding protein [Deltaproteobacteria bacterium]
MKRIVMCLLVLFLAANCFAADLIIYSGAGLIKPMEEFKGNFETLNKISVDVHYGSSGEIFSQVAAGQPCDVLIPGAEKYTQDALKNGWVVEDTIKKLVLHVPVIAVPQGNPANITGLQDLTKEGVRVSIGDPKAPAIGRVAKKMLTKNGLWDTVTPNITVYAPTVNQLLIYVALKQVDAAIIWEDLVTWAEGKGKLEVVRIPKEQNIIMTIPTAVCTKAPNKDLALKFNEYVSSDEGMQIWKKWGFEPYTN